MKHKINYKFTIAYTILGILLVFIGSQLYFSNFDNPVIAVLFYTIFFTLALISGIYGLLVDFKLNAMRTILNVMDESKFVRNLIKEKKKK